MNKINLSIIQIHTYGHHNSKGNKTYLNNCVNGFQSGTGILRTCVPGGRKLRNAICVARLPHSQIYTLAWIITRKKLVFYSKSTMSYILLCITYQERG